jgi:ATP-dependent DNA helicase RecQ
MSFDGDVRLALRRYWGYESFRPLQESIIASLLQGHDVCAIMPTGGGKSLCYQLPAAMAANQTAVVVSPLIALMHDQVARLLRIGIPAALVNSSLAKAKQMEIIRESASQKYRLLYLSPERLAAGETLDWLKQVPISFFAIDEAHCISEWGHEFRPDYRNLARLRTEFPDRAIAAFTASATRRVRHDIVRQLHLHDPHKYIASFHRANLRYMVTECDSETQPRHLLSALRRHAGGSVIIYVGTIAKVRSTVAFLADQGITAIPYHGQMDSEERRRNQEIWMCDRVRVLVGTIAFGLGIDKPSVRAVIHLSLPKSLEQYYQEAGRAGRDTLKSDCILLWQKQDAGLIAHFISQIGDPTEKERAWQRYHEIRRYAESATCRHLQICRHFGENPKWTSCTACDICDYGSPGETGVSAMAVAGPRETQTGDAIDPNLRQYLSQWRRRKSEEQGCPAFVVMHDSSLEDLCRIQPRSLDQLLQVRGFGKRKVDLLGEGILAALDQFRNGARAAAKAKKTRSRRTLSVKAGRGVEI